METGTTMPSSLSPSPMQICCVRRHFRLETRPRFLCRGGRSDRGRYGISAPLSLRRIRLRSTSVGAEILGIRPEDVLMLRRAQEHGVGTTNLDALTSSRSHCERVRPSEKTRRPGNPRALVVGPGDSRLAQEYQPSRLDEIPRLPVLISRRVRRALIAISFGGAVRRVVGR